MHFNALGTEVAVDRIFGEAEIFPSDPKAPADYRNSDPHEWFAKVIDTYKYQYVFVTTVSPKMQQVLGDYFGDIPIKENTLYRVADGSDAKLRLLPAMK